MIISYIQLEVYCETETSCIRTFKLTVIVRNNPITHLHVVSSSEFSTTD